MATTTANLGLTKPDYTEKADVAVINGNMDKIDAAMQQRDRYMALNADVLVMYAVHNFGNSMAIKELAERKGKRVINYPDLP